MHAINIFDATTLSRFKSRIFILLVTSSKFSLNVEMKHYFLLSIFSVFAMALTVELKLNQIRPAEKKVPIIFRDYQINIKEKFNKPENANLLFSFLMGTQQGISPHTREAFKACNLNFLLSPSGVHLGGFFLVAGFFLKRFSHRGIRRGVKFGLLAACLMLPNYEAIHRLAILRFGFSIKFLAKLKISSEQILMITFIISFCLGHYFNSPFGYLFSLLYIGTFFFIGDRPKGILVLAFFANQVMIALFMGSKVSFLATLCGLVGVFIFSFLYPLILIFFATFWIFSFNWIEPLIQLYLICLKFGAHYLNGTFTSSSPFLLLAIWSLLFIKRKNVAVAVCLLLHSNSAMTPSLFSS